MYTRGVLSGTFILVNKYLVKELVKLGIWNDSIVYGVSYQEKSDIDGVVYIAMHMGCGDVILYTI
jgi:hypothetical protein